MILLLFPCWVYCNHLRRSVCVSSNVSSRLRSMFSPCHWNPFNRLLSTQTLFSIIICKLAKYHKRVKRCLVNCERILRSPVVLEGQAAGQFTSTSTFQLNILGLLNKLLIYLCHLALLRNSKNLVSLYVAFWMIKFGFTSSFMWFVHIKMYTRCLYKLNVFLALTRFSLSHSLWALYFMKLKLKTHHPVCVRSHTLTTAQNHWGVWFLLDRQNILKKNVLKLKSYNWIVSLLFD